MNFFLYLISMKGFCVIAIDFGSQAQDQEAIRLSEDNPDHSYAKPPEAELEVIPDGKTSILLTY